MSELRERMQRCRKFGDITGSSTTKSGVVFDTWLEGPQGAGFELFREKHHTDEDIEAAKRRLKRDRDVVTLRVTRVDDGED